MDRKEIRETIGVTALVLSLIFVGLEMRQNTRLLQAQTRDAITSKQLETVSWVATNQQNSRVFRVGWDSMETLMSFFEIGARVRGADPRKVLPPKLNSVLASQISNRFSIRIPKAPSS